VVSLHTALVHDGITVSASVSRVCGPDVQSLVVSLPSLVPRALINLSSSFSLASYRPCSPLLIVPSRMSGGIIVHLESIRVALKDTSGLETYR
jgi:hypothetical protein